MTQLVFDPTAEKLPKCYVFKIPFLLFLISSYDLFNKSMSNKMDSGLINVFHDDPFDASSFNKYEDNDNDFWCSNDE